MTTPTNLPGLILAAGRGLRLGGRGKAGISLAGETLLAHSIARLAPQCTILALNLPSGAGAVADHRPVLHDANEGFQGPLAGVLAGLDWAAAHAPASHLLTAPVDSPFLPRDLGQRLSAALPASDAIVIACSGDRPHPLHALWPLALREALRAHLAGAGSRKVRAFQERFTLHRVEWPVGAIDPFFNINTDADLAQAQAALTLHPDL